MDEIARTQQRTRGYWYCDGIAELVGGVALALVGFPMIAAVRTGIDMLSTVALMVMILLFPASARALRFLKDRITHARTGYVKYPRPTMSKGRKLLLLVLFLCTALVMLLTQWNGEFSLDGMVGRVFLIGAGAGMTVAFAYRAAKLRIPRLYATAVVVAAITTVSGIAGYGYVEGMGLLLAALGATSVITGGVTLIRYIQHHPKAPLEIS